MLRRLGRRRRGCEGARRFVEQRHQGRRTRRRCDFRPLDLHLFRLLPQGGPPGLDLVQLPGLRVQAPHPGLRHLDLVSPLPQRRERFDDPGVLCRQAGDHRLVDSRIFVRQELVQRIDGAFLEDGQTLCLLTHPLVHVEPQQGAQHAAPLPRRRLEEAGELALRQHHGLHERGGAESEDLNHPVGRGAHLVRQALKGAAGVPLLQADHLHAIALEDAGDAVAARAGLEIQHHGGPVQRRRDHLGPALDVDPRDLAIEREEDGIEQSRLARPRRP